MARHRELVDPRHVVVRSTSSQNFPAGRIKVTGSEEMKTWLRDSVKGHWYFIPIVERDSKKLYVEFCQRSDAALFKLAWGGVL